MLRRLFLGFRKDILEDFFLASLAIMEANETMNINIYFL